MAGGIKTVQFLRRILYLFQISKFIVIYDLQSIYPVRTTMTNSELSTSRVVSLGTGLILFGMLGKFSTILSNSLIVGLVCGVGYSFFFF